LARYGVVQGIRKIQLYQQAFVHRSYCKKNHVVFVKYSKYKHHPSCVPLQRASNERLEFLGDAVLGQVIAEYLYHKYPAHSQGQLSTIRASIVCGSTLARYAKHLKFNKYLLLCKPEQTDKNNRENPRLLEDCFEAFIAALCSDLGHEAAKTWIANLVEELSQM
jgi:dsRNA-specific ribonuclease